MKSPGPRSDRETHRLLGAEVFAHGTEFRIFSDNGATWQLRLLHPDRSLRSTHDFRVSEGGFHEVTVPGAAPGDLYQFVLDGKDVPDPYARFFPFGVHGPAMVVDSAHPWLHAPGPYRPLAEQIIYELHVGAFTPEGTYNSARTRLPALVDLGVTAIELMPLSSFPGRRGWGYEGVAHFAPYAEYGTPSELRGFIDEAHGLGLSVLLDVVYNHFGPAGNYLSAYSDNYFTKEGKNAWGAGPNFAHPAMRNYVLANARYWLEDFRLDGLRLDATHAIVDPSPTHILAELADLAHALTPRRLVFGEDERNDSTLVKEMGLDGIWADDFHHVAHVTATHEQDGYYACYAAGVEELATTIRQGWLYQGQPYPTTGKPRGRPALDLPAESFVYCLQNHDQVGNRALGDRLSAPGALRPYCALSTVLLFLPMTPLLFMGQEWAASTPFQFFTDHEAELGEKISAGRRAEFQHFLSFADPTARESIPDPQAEETFTRSKLKWDERSTAPHAHVLALYKALITLRQSDPVLRSSSRTDLTVDVRDGLLVIRRTAGQHQRVLLANLSDHPVPEALVARMLDGGSVLLRSDLLPGGPGPLPEWTALVATATNHLPSRESRAPRSW